MKRPSHRFDKKKTTHVNDIGDLIGEISTDALIGGTELNEVFVARSVGSNEGVLKRLIFLRGKER